MKKYALFGGDAISFSNRLLSLLDRRVIAKDTGGEFFRNNKGEYLFIIDEGTVSEKDDNMFEFSFLSSFTEDRNCIKIGPNIKFENVKKEKISNISELVFKCIADNICPVECWTDDIIISFNSEGRLYEAVNMFLSFDCRQLSGTGLSKDKFLLRIVNAPLFPVLFFVDKTDCIVYYRIKDISNFYCIWGTTYPLIHANLVTADKITLLNDEGHKIYVDRGLDYIYSNIIPSFCGTEVKKDNRPTPKIKASFVL